MRLALFEPPKNRRFGTLIPYMHVFSLIFELINIRAVGARTAARSQGGLTTKEDP